MALAQEGAYERAWQKYMEENPLPGTHGRACYHPCESACNRQFLDQPVSIHSLDRFLGDLANEHGWTVPAGSSTGKRVLVVGAGPAGLSCAYQLRRLGHHVRNPRRQRRARRHDDVRHSRVRVPVMFFFDGFRTSHEENKITVIPDDHVRAAIDDELVRAHRARALTPEQPVIRGTAHNPDTFFQAREAADLFYARVPDIVQRAMDRVGALTGRAYTLFRYSGHPEADRVVIVIGSAFEVVDETAAWLNAHGEKVAVLNVALYRPWDADRFRAALPAHGGGSAWRRNLSPRSKESDSRSVGTCRYDREAATTRGADARRIPEGAMQTSDRSVK